MSFSSGTGTTATANLSAVILGAATSIGGTGDITINPGITGGSNTLTKIGAGTLLLNGANTYTGATTITAGRLAVGGSLTSAVTATTGTLAPYGTPSTTGNVAINGGGTFQVQITGPTVGTQYDQLTVGGTVTLGGALDIIAGPGLTVGTTFTILNKTSAPAISGIFAGKAQGSIFAASGYWWQITNTGGNGNDVALTSVTALDGWRFTYFGTTSNTGNAADLADPNKDGETNLMEFATGQNPNAATTAAPTIARNGGMIEFTYIRSVAAMGDGVSFTVEWSDTLAVGSWGTAGVTEQILTDNGTVQTVKATMPFVAGGKRYVHLKVVRP